MRGKRLETKAKKKKEVSNTLGAKGNKFCTIYHSGGTQLFDHKVDVIKIEQRS